VSLDSKDMPNPDKIQSDFEDTKSVKQDKRVANGLDISTAGEDTMIKSLKISSLSSSTFKIHASIMGLSVTSGFKELPTPKLVRDNDFISLSFG